MVERLQHAAVAAVPDVRARQRTGRRGDEPAVADGRSGATGRFGHSAGVSSLRRWCRRASSSRRLSGRPGPTRASGPGWPACSAPTLAGRPGHRATRCPSAGRAGAAQARGSRPHRQPQDQQRAGPGAAGPADRQDCAGRGDGRGPARGRHGDGSRAPGPGLHGVHGGEGHRAAELNVSGWNCSGRPWCPSPRGRARSRTRPARRCGTGYHGGLHALLHRIGAGPHPYPWLVREFQRVIGDEARAQCAELLSGPGRTSSSRAWRRVECGRDIRRLRRHPGPAGRRRGCGRGGGDGRPPRRAARLPVVLPADEDGQIAEARSVSAGLDYPGVGPEHACLAESGRAEYHTATTRRPWPRPSCAPGPRASCPRSSQLTPWPGCTAPRTPETWPAARRC